MITNMCSTSATPIREINPASLKSHPWLRDETDVVLCNMTVPYCTIPSRRPHAHNHLPMPGKATSTSPRTGPISNNP